MGHTHRGRLVAILASVLVAVSVPGAHAAPRAQTVTRAEAIAVVGRIMAAGLECAYPGITAAGARITGYTATASGSAWRVVANIYGPARPGFAEVRFGIAFTVAGATDVTTDNSAAERILACAGPLDDDEETGPVVKAFTLVGAVEPGTAVSVQFRVRDDSGKVTVHVNLYEGGAWRLRHTETYRSDGNTAKHAVELPLAEDLAGPMFFCVWAENARKERSKGEPRSSCARIALVSPLARVSNGCGGKGWNIVQKVQNYFGNTSSYTDDSTGRSYTVSFVEACNLHDAGYGGQTVRDPLHGGKLVDYATWTRKQVDEKFRKDMALLCDRQIPASAPSARKACKENFRFTTVRTIGDRFFDANLMKAGVQSEGPRGNG